MGLPQTDSLAAVLGQLLVITGIVQGGRRPGHSGQVRFGRESTSSLHFYGIIIMTIIVLRTLIRVPVIQSHQ